MPVVNAVDAPEFCANYLGSTYQDTTGICTPAVDQTDVVSDAPAKHQSRIHIECYMSQFTVAV